MAVSSETKHLKDIYEEISVSQQKLRNVLINYKEPPTFETILEEFAKQVKLLENNESKMSSEHYLWCLRALTSDSTTNILCHLELAENEQHKSPQLIYPKRAQALRQASVELACHMRRPDQHACDTVGDGFLKDLDDFGIRRGSEASTESLKYTPEEWQGHLDRMVEGFPRTTGSCVLHRSGTQERPRYNKFGLLNIEESKLAEAATKAALEILVFAGKYIPLNVSKLMIIIRYLLKLHDFQVYYECSVWFSNLTVDESTRSKRQDSPWSQDDRIKKLKHMYDSRDYWDYKNLLYDTFFAVLESRFNISRIGDWTRSVIEDEIKAATAAKTCILSRTNDVRFRYNFSPRLEAEDEGLELLHSFIIRRYHTQSSSLTRPFVINKSLSLTTFLAELKKREAAIDPNVLMHFETAKENYSKGPAKDITFEEWERKRAGRIESLHGLTSLREMGKRPRNRLHRSNMSHPTENCLHRIKMTHIPKNRLHYIRMTHTPKNRLHCIKMPHLAKNRNHRIMMPQLAKTRLHPMQMPHVAQNHIHTKMPHIV